MKQIKVLLNPEIIRDENDNPLSLINLAMLDDTQPQKIMDYFSQFFTDDIDYTTDYSFEDIHEEMQFKLDLSYRLKKFFPSFKVTFLNQNKYYDLPIDEQGMSEIKDNFDLSQYILKDNFIKIAFDYEATGLWDSKGACTPLDWVPISNNLKQKISQWQKINNSLPRGEDLSYQDEQVLDEQSWHLYLDSIRLAVLIQQELPEWQVSFYYAGDFESVYPENEDTEVFVLPNLLKELKIDDSLYFMRFFH